jgi:hypothetical protein
MNKRFKNAVGKGGWLPRFESHEGMASSMPHVQSSAFDSGFSPTTIQQESGRGGYSGRVTLTTLDILVFFGTEDSTCPSSNLCQAVTA